MSDDVALFDMDCSIADYTASLVAALEQLRSPDEELITEENIWTIGKQKHIEARMNLIKQQPGWWLNLAPIQDGLDIMRVCRQFFGFHVAVLTKGPQNHPAAWQEKLLWCQRYIADADVTITFDKSRVYGKILYDDYPEYMLKWLHHRPRGLGIMPTTPMNKDFKHSNVVMYHGIGDMERVMQAIKIAKERKPGESVNYGH